MRGLRAVALLFVLVSTTIMIARSRWQTRKEETFSLSRSRTHPRSATLNVSGFTAIGEPSVATLVPNRVFKKIQGSRSADITGSPRRGQFQKGHGVAGGDGNRDGDVDLFIQTGGAVIVDKYHNAMFVQKDCRLEHKGVRPARLTPRQTPVRAAAE
jgi:hypothetical protein